MQHTAHITNKGVASVPVVVQAVVKREPLHERKYQRGWGTAEPHELNQVIRL